MPPPVGFAYVPFGIRHGSKGPDDHLLIIFSITIRHPKEPSCTYDPVEGLVLAPDTVDDPTERVKLLEAQISQFIPILFNSRHLTRAILLCF